jgi:multiple sugar transport system permease protein
MWLALLLNRNFRGKRLVRASMLLPFIIPTVLSTFAWRWMIDPTFSVLNWSAFKLGFISFVPEPGPETGLFQTLLYSLDLVRARPIPFLSDGTFAMWCGIIINTWRGIPFFAITLLAGLQTINPDLHEAASLDGANAWHRFWNVTWPLLKPVTVVVVVFSIIQTFSDFQLIYVLTGGGPANSTHLIATYAYQLGVGTGLLGEGAAISLFMFPVLFAVVWIQLRYLRRMEGA